MPAEASGVDQVTLENTLARIADRLERIENRLSEISAVLNGPDGPIAGIAENLQRIKERL